jgi:hypothetical protein
MTSRTIALNDVTLVPLRGTGHQLHRADWPVVLDAIEAHTAGGPDSQSTSASS